MYWAHEDEAWAKALTREALEGSFPISDERVAQLIELVEKGRIHQKQGEIGDDIEVGAMTLACFAACLAPVIYPAFARAFIGLDPSSEESAEMYAEQLSRMVAALGRAEPDLDPDEEMAERPPDGDG